MEYKVIMRTVLKYIFVAVLLCPAPADAQTYTLRNGIYEVRFRANGTISSFSANGENIEFRADTVFEGPSVNVLGNKLLLQNEKKKRDELIFGGEYGDLRIKLLYSFREDAFAVKVVLQNRSDRMLPVNDVMLRTGINTEMDSFPHWNRVYFPTMMRCEKNFFWGYLMNPEGSVLAIVSPDPVASWNHSYKSYTHRIFTTNLDLMHCLPLPERHPQDLVALKPHETKSWLILLKPAKDLKDIPFIAASLSGAALVSAQQYTVPENEALHISLTGKTSKIEVLAPGGNSTSLEPLPRFDYKPVDGPGEYRFITESKTGKTSEARFYVRHPWSWYLSKARENAIEQEQKGGSHTESWYGMFSMFLAQKYFPNGILLQQSMDKFNEIYPLMYDDLDLPRRIIVFGNLDLSGRIQNTACMASLLADMYNVLRDTNYLAKASRMCDFLLSRQDIKGAYRSGGHVHYTSVVYIAKSILEVCACEKKLAIDNNIWQQRYSRHFKSALRAVDELAASLDNIETEGEMTYEDGMIACSYTQIAMMATLTGDSAERERYTEAAEYLRKGHRCLSQLEIPDSRMNGGSLRYWESQYDILSFPNLMSSPHGWSAWSIYGLYYLYQLTGNQELLEQIYNGLGSCVQLIDGDSGILRWAFCVDPYITGDPRLKEAGRKFTFDEMRGGGLLVKDPAVNGRINRGVRSDSPVGEQYLDMISGWYKAAHGKWVTGYWEPDGGCCDNDVHEIFKCLEETVMTNAFVTEDKDGNIIAYNCSVNNDDGIMEVIPYEKVVTRVHFNLKEEVHVMVRFAGRDVEERIPGGFMKWISSDKPD